MVRYLMCQHGACVCFTVLGFYLWSFWCHVLLMCSNSITQKIKIKSLQCSFHWWISYYKSLPIFSKSWENYFSYNSPGLSAATAILPSSWNVSKNQAFPNFSHGHHSPIKEATQNGETLLPLKSLYILNSILPFNFGLQENGGNRSNVRVRKPF